MKTRNYCKTDFSVLEGHGFNRAESELRSELLQPLRAQHAPQGLKPPPYQPVIGTTEVVPLRGSERGFATTSNHNRDREGADPRAKQRGVALIMTLILVSVLSAMAVSFLFLSQTETWSTLNYRLTSQARDGAEAGINSATNYLVNTYTPPGTGVLCTTDVLGCYNLTTYPVQILIGGNPVGLKSSGSSAPSTLSYPVSAVQDAYDAAGVGKGTLTAGTTTITYETYAQLLAQRQITVYGGALATVQTWLIVSDGIINNGVRNAFVELTAILDKPIVPTFNFAAFGQSNQCSALTFSQAGTVVKSYDSTAASPPGGILNSGGNVGTNGNLTINSNATIDGSLSTPAVGTGTCGVGGVVTAETACAGCTLAGGVVELPQPITYTPPALPSPMDTDLTAESGNNDCGNMPNCTLLAAKKVSLAPGTYGNLSIGSSMTEVHVQNGGVVGGVVQPGIYNVTSFALGNSALIIDSGPVILNVTGCATLNVGNTNCATYLATAVDFSSGAISNPSYNPLNLQIQYAGPGIINIKCGNVEVAATIYAPNAAITMSSNGSFYGSAIGNTVTVSSGATIYYDRNLQSSSYTTGNFLLGGFSWSKF